MAPDAQGSGKGKGSKEERKARKKAEHAKKAKEEDNSSKAGGKTRLSQETEQFSRVSLGSPRPCCGVSAFFNIKSPRHFMTSCSITRILLLSCYPTIEHPFIIPYIPSSHCKILTLQIILLLKILSFLVHTAKLSAWHYRP